MSRLKRLEKRLESAEKKLAAIASGRVQLTLAQSNVSQPNNSEPILITEGPTDGNIVLNETQFVITLLNRGGK